MRLSTIVIAVCAPVLLAGFARGDDAPAAPPPFQVSLEREPVNYIEPYYRAYITCGTNKFAFLVPQGFRFQTDPSAGKIAFCDREGTTTVSFAIHGPLPEGGELSPATCREFVATQHPNGKIVQEFSRFAAGRSGPAFDIQWKVSDHLYEWKRVVFVPSAVGVLEFTAVGSLTNSAKARSDLDLVLSSFCASKDGKLEVTHLGNMN